MNNTHYIAGGILTFIFVQGRYFVRMVMSEWDIAIGIPELPYNPYAWWADFMTAAAELTLCSLVAHSVVTGTTANAWARAIWVFIGLGAWNQMIDAVFGDVAYLTASEVIFFAVSLTASILTFVKWQKRNGSSL